MEMEHEQVIDHETSESVKERVREYWNAHPCGTQFTDIEWGSEKFFREVERFRYEIHPFMPAAARFNAYAGKKVLEVGCGLGTDLIQFAKAGAKVTGVDLTPQSIELVEKRFALENNQGEAMVADAENLPFADNQFDMVYSFGVLHHTPNTQRAIDEVYRVIKPGGECVVMLYHKTSLHMLLGVPLFAAYRLMRRNSPSLDASDDWIRIYDGSENPLGKAYSKSEVQRMFGRFQSIRFEVYDPIRRRFPRIINLINQKIFASALGFYLMIRGIK